MLSGLAIAVQRWASIQDGIREGFGIDVSSYIQIAEAAPSFPDGPVRRAFAERFPAHWLAGVLSDATGASLENAYRAESLFILAAVLAVVHWTLVRLDISTRGYTLAMGVLAASAYPLHQLLATPGLVADGVFLLGLALAASGFVHNRFALVLGGLVLATLGRQTAVPAAIAAGVCIAFRPPVTGMRWRAAAAAALVPSGVYGLLRLVADPWAAAHEGSGVKELTVIGFMTSTHAFAEHLGKIAAGVMVPVALIAAAIWRSRGPLPWPVMVVAIAVIAQPLLLGPVPINPGNEHRLAALAAPALAVAAGVLLAHARLGGTETLLLAATIGLAGLHPRYTNAPWSSRTWVFLELLAALAAVIVLGRRREPR